MNPAVLGVAAMLGGPAALEAQLVPSIDDFRLQKITRAAGEREWPFAVNEGWLSCVIVLGEPAVYFSAAAERDADGSLPRTVIVSTDPFELSFGNLGGHGLFAAFESLEQLIVRIAPYATLGRRLCAQPKGTQIGPGEL